MKLIPPFKPVFKGYLVDDAAQRFRKITTNKGEPSTYISFDSPQGRKMRNEFISLCKYALRKVYKHNHCTGQKLKTMDIIDRYGFWILSWHRIISSALAQ